MQQWAVLVLPHASICDAPAFNYYLTDLSLTLFHVAFLDVGTYICQLVVVFFATTADKSIRDDEISPNVGRISMEMRSKKKTCSNGWCDDEYSNTSWWYLGL